MNRKQAILVIDAGGTGVKALLFDKQGQIITRDFEATPVQHPEDGAVEYDPQQLWLATLMTVKKILAYAQNEDYAIQALGIANQRSSFCLWDKHSGEVLSPVISWQDVRAAKTIVGMNKKLLWRGLRVAAKFASFIVKSPFLIATSMLVLSPDHTIGKVRWYLNEHPDLEKRCKNGDVAFGTIDSFLIHQLTGKKEHLTDYTNASSTAMFNPFERKWNKIFCTIFSIPMAMFPEVRDSNGHFGVTDDSLTGQSIPIRAAIGDQQASLFGHKCFSAGSVKVTFGSGTFVCANVGPKGKVSPRGLFPLIAWVLDGKATYMLEGQSATAGTLIDWLRDGLGLVHTGAELDSLAGECLDTEGVTFVPTPIGIRFPYFKPQSKAMVLGLSLRSKRCHVARALFEGMAQRVQDILEGVIIDAKTPVQAIRTDGGVSKSAVLMQALADFCDCEVYQAKEAEMTAAGAAFLAGLSIKLWKDFDAISQLHENYTQYTPTADFPRHEKRQQWKALLAKHL